MLKLQSFFNNCSHLNKEYSPYLKSTEKSIEGIGKNRNISLDFSNTPIKQNKKLIKRNTRTNSFNSLLINQTEGGLYYPYSYKTKINEQKSNNKIMLNKGILNFKANHQKNKSLNIKKEIMNLNKNKQTMILRKKSQKKNCKRNFLNSYFINPNNVHISFNTVGNNFQIDSQQIKQNNNKSNLMYNNNKTFYFNNSELNKSISNISKIKNSCYNIKRSNKNINIYNEIVNIIQALNDEKQKIFLNDFKSYLNILNKIKKNDKDIIVNENDLKEIQKSGSILGNILYQNFKFRQKNEQLELQMNNIMKELNEIKQDEKDNKKEIENKNKTIKELNDKIDLFSVEMNKMKNIILNLNNKANKDINQSLVIKSSQVDLENISLADNININEELYNNVLNNAKKNMKQLKRNKSGKNIKTKDNLGILNFSSKVGNNNFNDEFLKNYDYFSDSWRKEADKMLQRRCIKLNKK
jgi:hypothetical protein